MDGNTLHGSRGWAGQSSPGRAAASRSATSASRSSRATSAFVISTSTRGEGVGARPHALMALQAVDDTPREVRIAVQAPHGEARPAGRPAAVLQHARSLHASRPGGQVAVRRSGALLHVMETLLQRAECRQERRRVRGCEVKADQDMAR